MTFTEAELNQFEKNAKKIADGPDEAGARLKQSLTDLKLELGPITKDIGRFFQDLGDDIVKGVTRGVNAINRLRIAGAEALVNAAIQRRDAAEVALQQGRANAGFGFGQTSPRELKLLQQNLERTTTLAAKAQDQLNRLRDSPTQLEQAKARAPHHHRTRKQPTRPRCNQQGCRSRETAPCCRTGSVRSA